MQNTNVLRGAARVPALAIAAVAASFAVASPADAARVSQYASFSTFPADYQWDGGGVQEVTGVTAAFDVGRSVDTFADSLAPGYVPGPSVCGQVSGKDVSCVRQLLRGGGEAKAFAEDGNRVPFALQAGDVARYATGTDKASLYDVAYPGAQSVTSSVLGSADFVIGRSPDSQEVGATLMRRVSRTVAREEFRPGKYEWVVQSMPGTNATACSAVVGSNGYYGDGDGGVGGFQQRKLKYTDVLPPEPSDPLGPDQYRVLKVTADGTCGIRYSTILGAPYEAVAYGRITSIGAASYGGTFGVPMLPGDLISYSEDRTTIAGDVQTSTNVNAVVPVGTVPPADVVAPKITGQTLGAMNTSIKAFRKSGMLSFITLDEPGTVKQELQLTVKAKKTKAKKGKKKSKKKAPVVPTVIGSGTATTAAPGQTAKVLIIPTPQGKKALKTLGKKPAKAILVTTVTDPLGNTVSTQAPLKLSAK